MLPWSFSSTLIFLWALQRLQRSINFIQNVCTLAATHCTSQLHCLLQTTADLSPFRPGTPLQPACGRWVSNIQCLVRDYGLWTCCPHGTGGTWPANSHQETKERETKTGPRVIGQAPTRARKYMLKSHGVHFYVTVLWAWTECIPQGNKHHRTSILWCLNCQETNKTKSHLADLAIKVKHVEGRKKCLFGIYFSLTHLIYNHLNWRHCNRSGLFH